MAAVKIRSRRRLPQTDVGKSISRAGERFQLFSVVPVIFVYFGTRSRSFTVYSTAGTVARPAGLTPFGDLWSQYGIVEKGLSTNVSHDHLRNVPSTCFFLIESDGEREM